MRSASFPLYIASLPVYRDIHGLPKYMFCYMRLLLDVYEITAIDLWMYNIYRSKRFGEIMVILGNMKYRF